MALAALHAASELEELSQPPLPHPPQLPRSEVGTAAGTVSLSVAAGSVAEVLHAKAVVAAAALYSASELESARRQRLAWRAARPFLHFAPAAFFRMLIRSPRTNRDRGRK